MFCTNCGNKIEDIAAFCPVCGQKVETSTDEVTLDSQDFSATTESYPDQSYDNNAYADQGYDNNAYAAQSYDNSAYADQSYDNSAYAAQGYDNSAYAAQSYDNNAYADQGYDNNAYADQQAPEQMMYPATLPQNQYGNNDPYGYQDPYGNQPYGVQNNYNNQNAYNQNRTDPRGQIHQLSDQDAVNIYRNFLSKMNSAATAWLIIGIVQLVIAIPCVFFGYGFVILGVGIWNVVMSSRQRKNVQYFRHTSNGVTQFVQTSGSGVLALILNIILGTWIGIIASILDMSARSYGKKNISVINYVEQQGWH